MLLLSACGKQKMTGGGVVVGNGLSGNAGQEFYSNLWKMGFEYSDDFTVEQRDGHLVIDNRHTKKQDAPLSSLIFSPVDIGERKITSRKDLRVFAQESESRIFDNLGFQIAGGTGVLHETQFKYENGSTGKLIYFYFLSRDLKVFKAKLQEPMKSDGKEAIALRNILRSIHYGSESLSPGTMHYVESEDEDTDA